jgi:hypothetical protein
MWWRNEEEQLDVIALGLPVDRRLKAFAQLGRAAGGP